MSKKPKKTVEEAPAPLACGAAAPLVVNGAGAGYVGCQREVGHSENHSVTVVWASQ